MTENEEFDQLEPLSFGSRHKKMTKNEKLEQLKEELLNLEFEVGSEEDCVRAEQILVQAIMTLTTSSNYELAREICDAWLDIPKWYE